MIRGISSMATRLLLAELAEAYAAQSGCPVHIESVGGVNASQRVQAGEPFDVVILASDAVDRLIMAGRVDSESKIDLVRSSVAVAVRTGSPHPDISNEDAVRTAVLAAKTVGYSTGPSGVALSALFRRWGIAEAIAGRIVIPPPGVAVGTLVATGEIELAFQQLSELMGLEGVEVLGPLPAEIQIVTTFSAGVCTGSAQASAAREMLEFMCSPQAAQTIRLHGMEPARA